MAAFALIHNGDQEKYKLCNAQVETLLTLKYSTLQSK